MNRRGFLTGVLAGAAFSAGNALLWQQAQNAALRHPGDSALSGIDAADEPESDREQAVPMQRGSAAIDGQIQGDPLKNNRYLEKIRFFEREFEDDIRLREADKPLLHSVLIRLEQVQRIVGHGNYNLISFDRLLKMAKAYSAVGEFSKAELAFMEKVFFTEAKSYGFFGHKVTGQLTSVIPWKFTEKVPYSGHFLFKGDSLQYYEKLKKDVGNIILTSGIRSNVKQMHLFLARCAKSKYNLSKASRALAPPGHSYHGIGDFDVGKIGFGYNNFTAKFAGTDEFERMQDLGYVKIRYTEDNNLGVRFEPWHIKVV